MAQYNIEMSSYNGTSYDQLYPKTLLANVSDWSNSIYSKSEVYSKEETYPKSNLYTKAEVDSQITNTIDAYIPELDLNKYKEITKVESLNGNRATIISPSNFNDFSSLAIFFNNITVSRSTSIRGTFLNTGSLYNNQFISTETNGNNLINALIIIFIVNDFWTSLSSSTDTSKEFIGKTGEFVNLVNSLEILLGSNSESFQSGSITIYGY